MFYIKIIQKNGSLESIKVHKEVTTIGGDFKNHIRCEGKDLEGIQLRIMIAPEFSFKVKDLKNSGKILYKNTVLNQEISLKSNEKLIIGSTEIFFSYPRDEEITGRKFKSDPIGERIEHLKEDVSFIEPLEKDSYSFSEYEKLYRKIQKSIKDKNVSLYKLTAKDFTHLIQEELAKENIHNTEFLQDMQNEYLAYGPITHFLSDNDISEIIINGLNALYIEKQGKLIKTNKRFAGLSSLTLAIDRLLAQSGTTRSKDMFLIDARLNDGSRMNVVMNPVAIDGPNVTIRKFMPLPFSEESLVETETLTKSAARFLKTCVQNKISILISGGTSSGKTTLLNFLSSFISPNERIITIEDTAELKLGQPHVVRLEAKKSFDDKNQKITLQQLVINALRMRPDRIIIGECRGPEALDMLQAMNTGHEGSITTIHSNSPRDVFSRLETMVVINGIDIPIKAIRHQISSALTLIIHLERFADGKRRIVKITEITGLEQDIISTSDIFHLQDIHIHEDGSISCELKPTGIVPTFYENLKRKGIKIDLSLFGKT